MLLDLHGIWRLLWLAPGSSFASGCESIWLWIERGWRLPSCCDRALHARPDETTPPTAPRAPHDHRPVPPPSIVAWGLACGGRCMDDLGGCYRGVCGVRCAVCDARSVVRLRVARLSSSIDLSREVRGRCVAWVFSTTADQRQCASRAGHMH